jgi:hypothetical protein
MKPWNAEKGRRSRSKDIIEMPCVLLEGYLKDLNSKVDEFLPSPADNSDETQ